MRAGRLRFRVQIQQDVGTQDANGQVIPSWATIATVWADCRPLSGKEVLQSDSINAEQMVRFLCRWPFTAWSPREQLRIVFNGANYDVISAINEGERNRELSFVCRKGVNRG